MAERARWMWAGGGPSQHKLAHVKVKVGRESVHTRAEEVGGEGGREDGGWAGGREGGNEGGRKGEVAPGVRGSGSGSSSSSSSATSAHREDMDDTAVSSSRRARRAHSRRALSKARGGKGLYSALCAHCDRPAARTKGEEGSRGSELSAR
eukprot:scaffold108424_cov30-Tisochrysis_lutea.AAC.3